MSRRLYIAIRGDDVAGEVPVSNRRRLYGSEEAAWAWVDSLIHPRIGGHVHEVDLDETVKLSREPELTWQARYEHAERRATRWLGLMERLEPIVRRKERPSGTLTIKAVDLARLMRTFSAWQKLRDGAFGETEALVRVEIESALDEALSEALAQVDRDEVDAMERTP